MRILLKEKKYLEWQLPEDLQQLKTISSTREEIKIHKKIAEHIELLERLREILARTLRKITSRQTQIKPWLQI
jgi:hypothetical protein